MSHIEHAAHNANTSTDVLPDDKILAIEAVSLSFATVSVLAALIAFYWYAMTDNARGGVLCPFARVQTDNALHAPGAATDQTR